VSEKISKDEDGKLRGVERKNKMKNLN